MQGAQGGARAGGGDGCTAVHVCRVLPAVPMGMANTVSSVLRVLYRNEKNRENKA